MRRRSNRASRTSNLPIRQKLVIVGDGGCGKTCLLRRFMHNDYNENAYLPTVFENYVKDLVLPSGLSIELTLWDTAGQEDYDRLRPLSYPDTDIILLAFAINAPDSFRNVHDKWIAEVKHFLPQIPVLLVALKTDLRGIGETIGMEEGARAGKELGCEAYMECSSKTGEGVMDVFEKAGTLALERNRKSPRTCVIL